MPTPEEIKANEINEFAQDSPPAPAPGPEPPPAEPPVAPPPTPPPAEPPAPEPPPAVPPVPPVEPPPVPPTPPVEPPKPQEPPVPPVPPTPPVPPAPLKDPKDTQIEELTKTLGQMREQMERMAQQMAVPPTPVAPTPRLDAQGQPIVEPPPITKFLEKEEDLDKMLNSVDNFNAGMTRILTDGTKGILSSIPQLIAPIVTQVVTQKLAVQEFFSHNQDLANNRAYVGVVANELAAANPTWTLENIIQNLGTEVRKRLALAGNPPAPTPAPGQPPTPPTPPAPTPAFVPGGNARPPSGPSAKTALEQGIDDLIGDFIP